MKFKPRKQQRFEIVGVTEELTSASVDGITPAGLPKDSLGAFTCKTGDDMIFNVGSGPALTREAREIYWRDKKGTIGRTLLVKYQELSKGGIPIFPIAVEVL